MSNKPSHEIFAVREGKNGKAFWSKVGALFPNKDGKGFSVRLELIPIAGQDLVARVAEAKTEAQEGGAA